MEQLRTFALVMARASDPTLNGARLQEAADRMLRQYGANPTMRRQHESWLATTRTPTLHDN
jgi:hypothetical protein